MINGIIYHYIILFAFADDGAVIMISPIIMCMGGGIIIYIIPRDISLFLDIKYK